MCSTVARRLGHGGVIGTAMASAIFFRVNLTPLWTIKMSLAIVESDARITRSRNEDPYINYFAFLYIRNTTTCVQYLFPMNNNSENESPNTLFPHISAFQVRYRICTGERQLQSFA